MRYIKGLSGIILAPLLTIVILIISPFAGFDMCKSGDKWFWEIL